MTYLFEDSEWDFKKIDAVTDAIEEIAIDEMGLDVYPNQIEIITSEQMLDAYSSIGMPLMYHHWSFGKQFVNDERNYRTGRSGLAYEIVINSNPCISYLMEENTMAMQSLVIAHAAFGHNHFFKNNYLFKQWTHADTILDYLDFAKKFIWKCEQRYGKPEVERILDSCHALMNQGIDRYRRPTKMTAKEEEAQQNYRAEEARKMYNEIWKTIPVSDKTVGYSDEEQEYHDRKKRFRLPEENLLYFIEKNSPVLNDWQREIIRIVRKISQYFYPQRQTKVCNEGFATYSHYSILNRMYDKGLLTDGTMFELLTSHTNVVFQPGFNDRRYNQINPYYLGFEMFQDIKRISNEPTFEDRDYFEWAGDGKGHERILDAAENYRDESFIQQYLSPHLMRKMRLFDIYDEGDRDYYEIASIHNEKGYKSIKKSLARSYNTSYTDPDIQVNDVNLLGDRTLHLTYSMIRGTPLQSKVGEEVLKHVRRLWGYDVCLATYDTDKGAVTSEITVG